MVRCQVEMEMERLGGIHCDSSNLVQNLELRYILLLVSHMGRLVLL